MNRSHEMNDYFRCDIGDKETQLLISCRYKTLTADYKTSEICWTCFIAWAKDYRLPLDLPRLCNDPDHV